MIHADFTVIILTRFTYSLSLHLITFEQETLFSVNFQLKDVLTFHVGVCGAGDLPCLILCNFDLAATC